MTEGKSVGGEAPSAPFGYCTVLLLVGKWITIDMTEDKSVDCKASTPQCVGKCWGTYSCEVCTWGGEKLRVQFRVVFGWTPHNFGVPLRLLGVCNSVYTAILNMWKLKGCLEVKNCKGKPSNHANLEQHHGVLLTAFQSGTIQVGFRHLFPIAATHYSPHNCKGSNPKTNPKLYPELNPDLT